MQKHGPAWMSSKMPERGPFFQARERLTSMEGYDVTKLKLMPGATGKQRSAAGELVDEVTAA